MVRKFFLCCGMITFLALAASAQAVNPEIEKMKALVDAGAAPRAALEKMQADLDDQADETILKRTLYATTHIEDISDQDCLDMVAAAQRRVDRKKQRLDELRPLVEQGIYARSALEPIEEELRFRELTLSLAQNRAQSLKQLVEMVKQEQALQEESADARPIRERFDGNGTFSQVQFKSVLLAFERHFNHALPISANGETAVHKAMGFDHRGRVDIALAPDSPEGVWLRQYLEQNKIPFYAFRAAMAGRATAAHIHIGPPSLRLRAAD